MGLPAHAPPQQPAGEMPRFDPGRRGPFWALTRPGVDESPRVGRDFLAVPGSLIDAAVPDMAIKVFLRISYRHFTASGCTQTARQIGRDLGVARGTVAEAITALAPWIERTPWGALKIRQIALFDTYAPVHVSIIGVGVGSGMAPGEGSTELTARQTRAYVWACRAAKLHHVDQDRPGSPGRWAMTAANVAAVLRNGAAGKPCSVNTGRRALADLVDRGWLDLDPVARPGAARDYTVRWLPECGPLEPGVLAEELAELAAPPVLPAAERVDEQSPFDEQSGGFMAGIEADLAEMNALLDAYHEAQRQQVDGLAPPAQPGDTVNLDESGTPAQPGDTGAHGGDTGPAQPDDRGVPSGATLEDPTEPPTAQPRTGLRLVTTLRARTREVAKNDHRVGGGEDHHGPAAPPPRQDPHLGRSATPRFDKPVVAPPYAERMAELERLRLDADEAEQRRAADWRATSAAPPSVPVLPLADDPDDPVLPVVDEHGRPDLAAVRANMARGSRRTKALAEQRRREARRGGAAR